MLSRQLIVWQGSRALARREASFVRAGHPERVRDLALNLGKILDLSGPELEALSRAALLHDIGRSLIPPGGDARAHPRVGADLLIGQDLPSGTLDAVRQHHERWDGRGFPCGLRGPAISRLARVLAVANALDHWGHLPPDVRAQRLVWERGLAFDPEVVNAYLQLGAHDGTE
ncbi:HD domain-containing protein [Deinococcus detaillensis]|uniref:HD domain-containing protein n=1 Tax=Deinococcus detaillensis TaxID=2592048 RepID=A0A553UW76_9DEIO|nr:HD domain-containing phosphohydrolase [Deinococcus detaillensis]TSA84456.1 HD domain-containing protein [Deinococcus detaillensis]